MAGDLHQNRLAGGKPPDLPQKGRAVGRAQEHAPLPLHRAVGDGAIDRAGAGPVAVYQQVFQPAADKQGRRLVARKMIECDRGHGRSFQSG